MKPEFTQKFTPLAQRLLKLKGSPETVPKIAQPTPTLITGARTLEEFIERSGGHFLGLLPETLKQFRCEYDPHFRYGDKIIPALKFPLGGGKYFWVSTSDINLRGVSVGSPKIYVANRIKKYNFVFADLIEVMSARQSFGKYDYAGIISLSVVDDEIIVRIKQSGIENPCFMIVFPNDKKSMETGRSLVKNLQKYFPAELDFFERVPQGWNFSDEKQEWTYYKKIGVHDLLIDPCKSVSNILLKMLETHEKAFEEQEQAFERAKNYKINLFAS